MSRVLWIDASVGVAGDMLLAALLDAGASEQAVREGLEGLELDPWTLELRTVRRGSLRALRADIRVAGLPEPGGPPDGSKTPAAAHHAHRHWTSIRAAIEGLSLSDAVRGNALAVYERLVRAEAHLHGVPVDEVALHEVGATDAVVDIVGVCLALESLGVERLIATPLPMGTGRIEAAHGVLSLPAPATLEVLAGWPVVPSPWPGEWVTPTGAALVAELCQPGGIPAMVIDAVGYGAGRKDPPQVANLVRAVVGHTDAAGAVESVVELECAVDDLTGEHAAAAVEGLLAAGALDAWMVPLVMKKGRPGVALCCLARPEDAALLENHLLRHTSSLGVRRRALTRRVLDRWFETVQTPYGEVRVKVAGVGEDGWRGAPEHEEVAAVARAASVPVTTVYAAAMAAWLQRSSS